MDASIPAVLASLRAMIPEHRVMVLDRYGEPEIGELLSEVVRGRSMEEQRALLLSQLSGEDVGKVEAIGEAAAVGEVEDARGAEDVKEVKAAEPKAEEDFDDDMLDIDDDEGEGLERAADNESIGATTSIIQVHRAPGHGGYDTEAAPAAPSPEPACDRKPEISGNQDDNDSDVSLVSLIEDHDEASTGHSDPGHESDESAGASENSDDSDSSSLGSLFEDRHDTSVALTPPPPSRDEEVPSALSLSIPGSHRRHSLQSRTPDSIHILFHIPSGSRALHSYTRINDMPGPFQTAFREEFVQMYLTPGHPDRKPLYEVYVRRENRAIMASRGQCVNIKTYSRYSSNFSFEGSFGNMNRACDCCTRLGRFCARMMKVDRAFQLVVYPVREDLRPRVRENDLDFWRVERE